MDTTPLNHIWCLSVSEKLQLSSDLFHLKVIKAFDTYGNHTCSHYRKSLTKSRIKIILPWRVRLGAVTNVIICLNNLTPSIMQDATKCHMDNLKHSLVVTGTKRWAKSRPKDPNDDHIVCLNWKRFKWYEQWIGKKRLEKTIFYKDK